MADYTIDIVDETGELTESELTLAGNVLEAAMAYEKLPGETEVSVTFVSDDKIHELNKDYRDKDRPTDVLSFALNDEEDAISGGEEMPVLLGDIIISVARAREQAEEYGHSLNRELGFLCVHGLLHLTGHHHETEEDEKRMFTKQEDILQSYGLKK